MLWFHFFHFISCFCLQSYSLKDAVPEKLSTYFVYLSKGVTGKRGDRVRVLFESSPRLWGELHEQFHNTREERLEARVHFGPQDFYLKIADKCKADGKTSKEDVLAEVVRFYVEDSKKGFSTFQLSATFGRVFSIVNGASAREFFYETASSQLFRW